MSDDLMFTGQISMSKEVFDDLMDNELNFNRVKYLFGDNGEINKIYVPEKIMLKDYFGELTYEDGEMIIDCDPDDGYHDTSEIFKSVSSKLGENDRGYVELVNEYDGECYYCYWLAKDKIEYWQNEPETPAWYNK